MSDRNLQDHRSKSVRDIQEFDSLASRMRQKGKGVYYEGRVKGAILAKQFQLGKAVARRDSKEEPNCITSFAAWWEMENGWEECGSIYVEKEGNGAGTALLVDLFQIVPQGRKLFLITSNPAVVRGANRFGFVPLMFATEEQRTAWGEEVGFQKDRVLPEGALLSNVAQTVREGQPLLRTLLVR